jgi:hypothetical protein
VKLIPPTVLALCLTLGLVLGLSATAQARWGKESCSLVTHCYGLDGRNIEPYGGVLASIDFVNTMSPVYEGKGTPWAPAGGFVDNEQWISWPKKPEEWVETGQANGWPEDCCSEHPFFAEEYKGKYKEYLAYGTEPLNEYNHYVLFDANLNGVFHIYWGCCEVASYGGWPVYLMEQEGGIEAAADSQPYNWGKQEVAASNGGEWTPWSGATMFKTGGVCVAVNPDNSAAGNMTWSTQPGC